eukprot:401708-Rhodomonas_salina.1
MATHGPGLDVRRLVPFCITLLTRGLLPSTAGEVSPNGIGGEIAEVRQLLLRLLSRSLCLFAWPENATIITKQVAAERGANHHLPVRFRRNSRMGLSDRFDRFDEEGHASPVVEGAPKRHRRESIVSENSRESQASRRGSLLQDGPKAMAHKIFGTQGKRGWIISPSSPFAQFVLYISTLLLLYVAFCSG